MSKHLEASLTFFIVFSWALPCDTWLKCHCFKSTPSSSSLLFYSISGLGSLTVSLLYQLSTLWSMILCHFSFHAKRNSPSAMAWMSSILPTFSCELFNKDLEAPGEGSGSSPQHFLWMSACDSALRLLLPSFSFLGHLTWVLFCCGADSPHQYSSGVSVCPDCSSTFHCGQG